MVTDGTIFDGGLEGGCLCGAVRYRMALPVLDAAYCHCRMCQKASGAPVVAWVSVAADRFAYSQGAPTLYQSSDWARREICGRCGTPLVFRYLDPARPIDVTIASLDDPASLAPQYHIWTSTRLPWFETADTLPRHKDKGPDT